MSEHEISDERDDNFAPDEEIEVPEQEAEEVKGGPNFGSWIPS